MKEEGKKPADKGGCPNHRRAEEVAFEERIEFYRPQTINVISEINTYHKIQYFDKVMSILIVVGGEPLLDRFREGCFGHLLHWKPGNKCNMALHHVISRQIKATGVEEEELWFLINGRKICFSIQDYALVTGLNFGTSSFDPTADHDVQDVEVFKQFCGGQRISIGALGDRFCDRSKLVDDEDGSLHLRVAHVLVLYSFFLGYDLLRSVESWVWALVDDLEAFARFPWGAYTYKILKHYVTNVNTKPRYHFYGPAWALNVWSMEVIPGYGTAVGKYVNKHARPRCLRWKFQYQSTVDLQPLFETKGKHCINLTPDDVERYTQYWQSVLNPDVLGLRYKPPVNALRQGEQYPTRPRVEAPRTDDVNVSRLRRSTRVQTVVVDEDEDEDEETQRQSDHRQDTGKRASPSSSSSSGREHHTRLSNRDWCRMEDMLRQSEDRIIDKAVMRVEEKLFPKMKRWFESWIDKVRCGCSHSTLPYMPPPDHMPRPDTRDGDEEPQTDVGLPIRHSDIPIRPSDQKPQWYQIPPYSHNGLESGHIPPRYSLHEFGTNPGAAPSYHQDLACQSMLFFDQLEIPPGFNAESAKAAEIAGQKKKEEQSFDGGSSSMHFLRKAENGPTAGVLKKPALEDAFRRGEQCESLRNDLRLDTAVAGHGKEFANQKDSVMRSEASRLKRDGPLTTIRAQSDSTEPLKSELKQKPGMSPRAGEVNVPELLIDPLSSKVTKNKKKNKLSNMSKCTRRCPSSDEETSDEGSKSSSGDERRRNMKKRCKKKKRRLSESSLSESSDNDRRLSKCTRRCPSSDEVTSDDARSELSSGDERRRSIKKRCMKKKRKHSESSLSESSDNDRHQRRRNRQKRRRASSSASSDSDARGSRRCHRHRNHHPHRQRQGNQHGRHHRSDSSSD